MNLEGVNFQSNDSLELIKQNQSNKIDPQEFQEKLKEAEQQNQESNKTNGENQELRQAAEQFEGLFIKQMLDSMRSTIPESDFLDGGQGEDIFEGMLDEQYAEKMAGSGGFGLADKIYDQYTSDNAGISQDHRF